MLLLGSIALLSACASGDKKPMETPKDQLVARLFSHVEKGEILYGHQDDLSYGHAWKVEDWTADSLTRSDVKAVTGKYPAIVGFDLGGIEMGDKANLDSVDFGLMRKAVLTHAKRGGIVTFSWHPRNPLTGGDAWDVSSDQVVKSILEGGELHDLFMNKRETLHRAAVQGTVPDHLDLSREGARPDEHPLVLFSEQQHLRGGVYVPLSRRRVRGYAGS